MKTDRTALLETALQLFHDRGYNAVTIYDIGAAVGVTGAALYRHFKSKSDVLGLLCDMTLDRLNECTGKGRSMPADELECLILGHVHFVVQYPKLLNVTIAEGRALDATWRTRIERRQREYRKRWQQALGELYPTHDSVTLDVAIYAAIGLINSAARWSSALRGRADFETRLVDGAHQVVQTLIGASYQKSRGKA